MNLKRGPVTLAGSAILIGAVLWMAYKSNRDVSRSGAAGAKTDAVSSAEPNPREEGFPTERRELGRDEFIPTTEQSRAAVEALYQFASIAPLYNFDSATYGIIGQTSRYRRDWTSMMVQTRSHVATVVNGHLISVQSLYDGSDTRRRPEAMNEWYKATGTLSKEEAVQLTYGLLTKLHGASVLEELKWGEAEFRAESVTISAPDGQRVRVTPFRALRLTDTTGVGRVTVEFRMGPTGSVGITKWFSP